MKVYKIGILLRIYTSLYINYKQQHNSLDMLINSSDSWSLHLSGSYLLCLHSRSCSFLTEGQISVYKVCAYTKRPFSSFQNSSAQPQISTQLLFLPCVFVLAATGPARGGATVQCPAEFGVGTGQTGRDPLALPYTAAK